MPSVPASMKNAESVKTLEMKRKQALISRVRQNEIDLMKHR